MTHKAFLAIIATGMMAGSNGWAQTSYSVPNNVSRVYLEGYATLQVAQGDENLLVSKGNTEYTHEGSRLTVSQTSSPTTLYLQQGRSMQFYTEDFSVLTIEGNFATSDSIMLHAEDFSNIVYQGSLGDTLRAHKLLLASQDFSFISSTQPIQYCKARKKASDFSHIDLSASEWNKDAAIEGEVVYDFNTTSDYAHINTGRYTINHELQHEREEDDKSTQLTDKAVSTMSSVLHNATKKRAKHPWKSEFDFAWGLHNWAPQAFGITSFAEGAGAVNTSFNDIALAFNVPIINTHYFALKLGMGLEWTRYNFIHPTVVFDPTLSPRNFADANNTNSVAKSYLKMRYATLPVKFEFGNRKKWHFSISVIGGIAWTGKNTGMRLQTSNTSASGRTNDYTINTYINPLMLDLRLAVQYKNVGAYIQAATLSAFKEGNQEYYPIKFGIIF